LKNGAIENVIQRIDGWLAREPVFCLSSGAVAGVTRGNEVVYWYGEIAGYYLSYLAGFMAETSNLQKITAQAARRVGNWLQEQWRDEPAPTRVYPCATADWRNDHVFAFDLAMILQGLAAVHRSGIGVWGGQQIADYIKTKLIDGRGDLRAIAGNSTGKPPSGWSSRIDGYQLKAAAGMIDWGREFNDPVLSELGERIVQHLGNGGGSDWSHLPLHPRLYAQEGALRCGLTSADSTAVTMNEILVSINIATERTDTIAQLLRLVLLSGMRGQCVDTLVLRLLQSIDSDGSVAIHSDQLTHERNTWCAIFARQALFFYLEARHGRKLQPGLCI